MAKVSATLSKTRSVYARDFFAWTQQQAERLRRAAVREPAPDLSLAPIARDSGQRSGKRFICGGRDLRQALYLPALVAVCFHAAMMAKSQALLAAGKPSRVALIAIMRKLIILANALIRDGRMWSPLPA